jgi:peptide/nickel transport system substrate-binding protein
MCAVLGVCAAAWGLVGCGLGRTTDVDYTKAIVVGTTDKIFALDPAGSYDDGSWTVENQIYPFLMNLAPGSTTPRPDIATGCGFTEPTVYTCVLKPGLTFANGDPLTARSVKFSVDRVSAINDPHGPATLLGDLAHTDVLDERTVAFTLKVANDQTFPLVLSTPATPIVDERVFPANRIMDDNAIVAARPFAGPFTIAGYQKNQLVEYHSNPGYRGLLGKPKADIVVTKYYAGSENLRLDLQNNAVDVGFRSFTPQDIETLRKSKRVKVYQGAGGELRYLVFNLDTMPGDSPEQKLAIRRAVAASVDRRALASAVYLDTYQPVYSAVPEGMPGATDSFRRVYGPRPDRALAAKFLADAGVATPVVLNLQYNSDHYGTSSSEEYAAIKSQLESTGLFRVNLQATEWVTYSVERVRDSYPLYQMGWFPDYPDADDYLTPFVGPDNFLKSHFDSPEIDALLEQETGETDPAQRLRIMQDIQDRLAREFVPIVPLLAGQMIAVAGKDIAGVAGTLDAGYRFRYGVLEKAS